MSLTTATAPRQDALNDQIFDVMAQLRLNHSPVAAWLLKEFFDSNVPVESAMGSARTLEDEAALLDARLTANRMGCYDAADWIANGSKSA
jgi:hypothetical protein